jgi:hypothetical protein
MNCRALKKRITKSHLKVKAAGTELAKNLAKDRIHGVYSNHRKLSIESTGGNGGVSVAGVEGISSVLAP